MSDFGAFSEREDGGGFNPLRVPGGSAVPWGSWEASAPANTQSGGEWVTWADLSGNGNTLSQYSTDDLPLVNASWRNGRPSARNDAVNPTVNPRTLGRATFTQGVATGDFTVVSVIEAGSGAMAGVNIRRWAGSAGDAGAPWYHTFDQTSPPLKIVPSDHPVDVAVPMVVVTRYAATPAGFRQVAIAHGEAVAVIDPAVNFPLSSNDGIVLGRRSGDSSHWSGDWAAAQFWAGTMTDADMDYLAAGFAARYEIVPSP